MPPNYIILKGSGPWMRPCPSIGFSVDRATPDSNIFVHKNMPREHRDWHRSKIFPDRVSRAGFGPVLAGRRMRADQTGSQIARAEGPGSLGSGFGPFAPGLGPNLAQNPRKPGPGTGSIIEELKVPTRRTNKNEVTPSRTCGRSRYVLSQRHYSTTLSSRFSPT